MKVTEFAKLYATEHYDRLAEGEGISLALVHKKLNELKFKTRQEERQLRDNVFDSTGTLKDDFISNVFKYYFIIKDKGTSPLQTEATYTHAFFASVDEFVNRDDESIDTSNSSHQTNY